MKIHAYSSCKMSTRVFAFLRATCSTSISIRYFIFLFFVSPVQSQAQSQTFTVDGTFTVPAGVTSLNVQCWGAGGGGSNAASAVGGGGGGGAFSSGTVPVIPGTTYNVVVGKGGVSSVNGTNTTFNTTSIVAAGGTSAKTNLPAGGAGGSVTACIGTIRYAGGNGATGSGTNAGGGGSGAGSTGNGNSAAGSNAGAAVAVNGGTGGAGRKLTRGNGTAGSLYGGGGGGAYSTRRRSRTGGAGANGLAIISWTCPTYGLNSTTVTGLVCPGNTAIITLTGSASGLPAGIYTVTYNLSAPNSATGLTATMTITTAGSGTFASAILNNTGSTTLTVTSLKTGSGTALCTSNITSNNVSVITVSNTGPAITAQPVSQSVCTGAPVSLSVTSPGAVSYQWKKNGVNIAGATAAVYTLPSYAAGNAGSYTVSASHSCASSLSTVVYLTTKPAQPAVTANASNTTVCPGTSINLAASTGSSVTLLTDNFNGASNEWNTVNNSTGGTPANAAWTLRGNGYAYSGTTFNSNDNSQFYLSNSNAQGGGGSATAVILQSPAFSTQGLSTGSLSFYHYYRFNSGTESAKVEASLNGTTWTALATYTNTRGARNAFALVNINLAAFLNQPIVFIRFKYDATADWYWAIDNVSVTGTLATPAFLWTASPAGFTSALQNPTGLLPAVSTNYNVVVTNGAGCTNTATVPVTVNATTVITTPVAPATQTILLGNASNSLSLSATGTALTYQWYSNTINSNSGGTAVGATNGGQTNIYSPPVGTAGTKYYYCVVSGTCGTVKSAPVTLTITNSNTWAGGGSANWNTAANWTMGIVPSAVNDAVIPAGNLPYPMLSASAVINNLTIGTGAELAIGSNTLTINGVISGAGTITGSETAGLVIAGNAGTLRFTAGGLNNYLKNFTVNNGASVTLGSALNIAAGSVINAEGTLTVTGTGVLVTGGNLTIKSNAFGTARIAPGRTSGGYITGDVVVERYIPQNMSKAWRLLATNTSGQTINAAWQEAVSGSGANPNPGFGTKITANGASLSAVQAMGFDTISASRSIYKYNQATDNLDPVSNTNSTQLSSEQGYFIFIRGDRSPGQFGTAAPTTSTVLRSKGSLFEGDQPAVNLLAGQWALVRNPFASRIDMRQVIRTSGVVDAFQLWDPKLSGAYGVGGYQSFTKNISSGNYEVSPGGGSYGVNGSVHNYIESGAAFFVQASGTAGAVQVVEAAKTAGSQVASFRPSSLPGASRLLFNIYANNPNSSDLVDGGYVDFEEGYDNGIDVLDVRKSLNFRENFGIAGIPGDLVVERRQPVSSSDTVFFAMSGLRSITYRLTVNANNFDAQLHKAVLEDQYTGTRTLLDLSSENSYDFTVNTEAASRAADRFRIVLQKFNVLPVTFTSFKAEQAGDKVEINWTVASQVNAAGYKIERSVDGLNFTSIGEAVVADAAAALANYRWTDAMPSVGVNLYRIKAIEKNGHHCFTAIEKITLSEKAASISIIANPVSSPLLTIYFRNKKAGKYKVRILDASGRSVYRSVLQHNGNSGTHELRLPGLHGNGIYHVQFQSPQGDIDTQQIQLDLH